MKNYEIKKPLIFCQDTLGESPLWDHRKKSLFWLDSDKGLIHSFETSSQVSETYSLGKKVGCIALHESHDFILATESGLSFWNPDSNHEQQFLEFNHSDQATLFNDGKVDPLGRFWIGTKGPKGLSNLYLLEKDDLIVKFFNLTTCNGLDWALDGSLFYHTDSQENTIYRYDIDLQSAELSNRTTFFKTERGTPDGLTLDKDGNIWTAIWDGWHVLQLSPAGEVLTEVSVPVQRPTSVAFGGDDLRKLFITSASVGLMPEERAEQPYAGDLFMIEPGGEGRQANLATSI